MSRKIVMVGVGYVGLVTGACLANFGHSVTCVDIDENKIDLLRDGQIPIFEPGLEDLVSTNVGAGRLAFTTDLKEAVSQAEVVFIAVGTPSRRGDGYADLQYVYSAAEEISKALNGYTVIVTKSTVPVGTGDEVENIIRAENPHADFSVASNPEFLREGAALKDFQHPDRVVIGVEDDRAAEVLRNVYRPLSLNEAPLMVTDRRTAEMTKYAANAFLAMKLTFINEIADLCESIGADVQAVARGMGLDNRIGQKFLNPGPGYGGSCFPKDTLALMKTGRDAGTPLQLVETTVQVNDQRKKSMVHRVVKACGGEIHGKKIGVLGLTFKPETDDMRESPATYLINDLQTAGASVKAFDPAGMSQARTILNNVDFAEDAYDLSKGIDCLVLITEWNEFRTLDLNRISSLMRGKAMVDLRNVYRSREVRLAGLDYFSVGRGHENN